jgi:hypothetical protein
MSKPMFARARAPTEPPRLYVTSYTQTTAQLYWEKPLLVTVTGKDENGNVKYIRRYLVSPFSLLLCKSKQPG